MITHRMATQSAPEPPTRLYKILAIGFLLITAVLFVVIIFVSSKSATIVIEAKQDTKKIDIAVPVSDENTDSTVKGSVTTTVFAFSQKYPVNGTKKVDGVAEGTVTLHNTSDSPQPLVKTTRLVTADGVLFRLVKAVTVPARGTATAPVYADKAGESGNIGPSSFTIPGLPAERQKEVYADSSEAMTGGVVTSGVVSTGDIQKAKDDYAAGLEAAYVKTLEPIDASLGRVVKVTPGTLSVDHKAGDETSAIVVTATSTVIILSYDARALSDVLDKQISSQVNTSAERFLPSGDTPETVEAGTIKDGSASLSVKKSITVTLDANVEMLAPKNFIGKKKEEIQRYILGLDHVAAVDVKFSPAWVLRAPSNSEKIKVVVKSM